MFKRVFEESQEDGAAGGGGETIAPADEQKARQLGWVPQDEWQGDPQKWKPAGDFLARGEELMPLLKANNRRLHQQVSAQSQEVQTLREQLAAQNEILQALKESNDEIAKDRKENQIRDLTQQIKDAREADDVALESRLQARLTNLTREEDGGTEKRAKEPARREAQDFRQTQWWQEWTEENDWYGQDEDRTFLADSVAQKLRANPANAGLKEKAFMDKVTQEVSRLTGGKSASGGRPRVEGGGGRGSGGGGAEPSGYASLPADAKAACDRQAKRLVGNGPGQFKTEKEFRAYYVKKYLGSDEQ